MAYLRPLKVTIGLVCGGSSPVADQIDHRTFFRRSGLGFIEAKVTTALPRRIRLVTVAKQANVRSGEARSRTR